MPIAASSAFIDLCQSQLQLLNQTLGALSAVVYVTEAAAATPPNFVPIFRYPQSSAEVTAPLALPDAPMALPDVESHAVLPPWQPATDRFEQRASAPPALKRPENAPNSEPESDIDQAPSERQLVLPLIHQETVVGAMVIVHHERQWRRDERRQLQQVADGVAAGYVLERQNQWLQQRLRAKHQIQGQQSEIFHNLLHQFRNPLTALGTFGKLLLRRLSPEDPNYSVATSIVRESERLAALVEDFDDAVDRGDADRSAGDWTLLTEPETRLPPSAATQPAAAARQLPGGLGHQLQITPQPLLPLLEPLATLGQALASERQLHFYAGLPEATLGVEVDAQALEEMAGNLLDNALKYARPDDWVWLQVNAPKPTAWQIGIAIGDTGPGIPIEDQPHLFERSYRGIQANSDIPGTGLGLAIAQELAAQMQGRIELISPLSAAAQAWIPPMVLANRSLTDSPGTLFILWLPIADVVVAS
ncbi:MAG: ATP-binding protein [Cyanobacteria bacterium J06554_6]